MTTCYKLIEHTILYVTFSGIEKKPVICERLLVALHIFGKTNSRCSTAVEGALAVAVFHTPPFWVANYPREILRGAKSIEVNSKCNILEASFREKE